MRKVSKDCDDVVDQVNAFKVGSCNDIQRVGISTARLEEIEKAGQIKLSDELRTQIEDVLNSYILRNCWDRNARLSKETRANSRSLRKHVHGLLDALDDVNRKLRSDGGEYHSGIAPSDQSLFHRAGIPLIEFYDQLVSLKKQLEEDGIESDKGGRPKDFFLPQFFCELEEIYLKAGGCRIGVTKTLDGRRESPFTDFVNAILRFAPVGVGPSSSPAVAVAWERQLRSRRAALIK